MPYCPHDCKAETQIKVIMTSSNGNIFRVTGPLCGVFIGHRWIPRIKAIDAELWCFLWSAPGYKRWSKQSWSWWSETPSSSTSLWCLLSLAGLTSIDCSWGLKNTSWALEPSMVNVLLWQAKYTGLTHNFAQHNAWQLSWCDLCKLMTWLNHHNHNYNRKNYHKIFIMH